MEQTSLQKTEAEFFCPPTRRFVFLFCITFGVYQFYWLYKNWRSIERIRNKEFSCFLRSVFFLFFSYSFFESIYREANKKGYLLKSRSLLHCILYTALTLVSCLFDIPLEKGFDSFLQIIITTIISYILNCLTLVPLLYAQNLMRFCNQHQSKHNQSQ